MIRTVRGSTNSILPQRFRRLDVVDAAPDAAGMNVGAVAVSGRINDGPHRGDLQDVVGRVAKLLRNPARGKIDVGEQFRVLWLLLQ